MKKKFYLRICLFLAFILLSPVFVNAQGEVKKDVLTGYVKDRNGQPLPGVNILVKDVSGTGISTDMEGKFTLDLKGKRALVFSFIGMKTKTVQVKDVNKPLAVSVSISRYLWLRLSLVWRI